MEDIVKLKIARVATVPDALEHVKDQIQDHSSRGAKMYIISSAGFKNKNEIESEFKAEYIPLTIRRDISILRDFITLLKLTIIFRKYRFDIVHSKSPKAGLLCAVAGFFARISIRIHTFTGQRWQNMSGIKRGILVFMDKVINFLNSINYCDGPKQLLFLVNENILSQKKVKCLHKGSVGGINLVKYDRENFPDARKRLRDELDIKDEQKIIIFSSRVARDKGIEELVLSFRELQEEGLDVVLLILGFNESIERSISEEALQFLKNCSEIKMIGHKNNPEFYLAGSDLFCLPSYREGFSVAILEALSMKIPIVATDIYGINDILINGQNGLLVQKRNIKQLTGALKKIIQDSNLGEKFAANGRALVERDFDCKLISALLWKDYQDLQARGELE